MDLDAIYVEMWWLFDHNLGGPDGCIVLKIVPLACFWSSMWGPCRGSFAIAIGKLCGLMPFSVFFDRVTTTSREGLEP